MILSKTVLVRVPGNMLGYYRERGYICETGSALEVKVFDLRPSSSAKVIARCGKCGAEQEATFRYANRAGMHFLCNKCSYRERTAFSQPLATRAPRGKRNPLSVARMVATRSVLVNGVSSYQRVARSPKMQTARRRTMESLGLWPRQSSVRNFHLYRLRVRRFTKQNTAPLSRPPGRQFNIDHKFSILEGFRRGICPWIIGHFSNLIVLGRRSNVQKGSRCSITETELFRGYEQINSKI